MADLENLPRVSVTAKGRRWWLTGHPWIYRDDLTAEPRVAPGTLTAVFDGQERFLGQAFYSAASRIALRLVSRAETPIDRAFWEERLDRAREYRRRVVSEGDAYRLVYAEADGFPGLIVDSYAGHLVVQVNHPGMERILPEISEILLAQVRPHSLTLRNDGEVRLLEGLPRIVETVYGDLPDRVLVQESGLQFWVDLRRGQKTGMFLDQRENRQAAAAWARGEVLDCFSYQGGFALHLAAGADRVTAVETSAAALAQARDNAQVNGIENITWVHQNCFDYLKEAAVAGRSFDVVVLDPPAFARSRADRRGAQKGYREINRRAFQLLKPGGVLITCSCSYNLGEFDFLDILREAARETGRQARLIERRSAARDHPALLALPESLYLKCFFLMVTESAG